MIRRARFLLCLLMISAAPAAAEPMTYQQIADAFETIAFGSEYTGQVRPALRRWEEPVRLGLQGDAPEYLEADIRNVAEMLSRTTGHEVTLYYSPRMQKAKQLPEGFDRTKVNVILFYLPRDELPKAMAQYFDNKPEEVQKLRDVSTCFAKFFTRKWEIRAAVVGFPAELPRDHHRACVVEEIAQIMGLANDSADLKESIFNDRNPTNELMPLDRLMLRILYDDRLAFGMPRETVLATLPTILDDYRRRATGQ